MGDVSEGNHLMSHGVAHQPKNSEHSPKTMVDASNIHLSMGQNQPRSCKSEINEEVDVTMGQFPSAVKMEDVADDVASGNPSSSAHHYLASNQHQNLMSVTTATLNAVNDYTQQVHHPHHHMAASDRAIGESAALYGIYS